MSTPVNATPRRTCVHLTAATVKVSAIVLEGQTEGEVTLTPVQCLGPACHFWLSDAGQPLETGDCSIVLDARFNAMTAGQVGMMNENVATLGQLVGALATKMGLATPIAPPAPPRA